MMTSPNPMAMVTEKRELGGLRGLRKHLLHLLEESDDGVVAQRRLRQRVLLRCGRHCGGRSKGCAKCSTKANKPSPCQVIGRVGTDLSGECAPPPRVSTLPAPAVSRESGAQLPRCASSCSAKQEAARCSLLLLGSTWRLGQVLFHSFAQYSLVGQGKQRENYSTRKVAGPCIPSILVPGWGLLKDFETNFPWDPRTSEFRDLNEI